MLCRYLQGWSWFLCYALGLGACAPDAPHTSPRSTREVASIPYRVIAQYAHRPEVFTQGFFHVRQGIFIESSGLYRRSFVQYVDILRNKVLSKRVLPPDIFAEGLTYTQHHLYVLTWKERKIFVLDSSLRLQRTLSFHKEGWGLTHNDSFFLVSTGSDSLYWYNKDWAWQRTLPVRYEGQPLMHLNELEWVDGYVFANVWQEDRIVKIDPHTGEVVGVIDMAPLLDASFQDRAAHPDAVLNGIAYDAQTRLLYVTGKNWPLVFALQLF